MMKYYFILLFSILIIITACDVAKFQNESEAYGLPSLCLTIDTEEMSELNANLFLNNYVNCNIAYMSNDYPAMIRCQGGLARRAIKRQYQMKFTEKIPISEGLCPWFESGESEARFIISSQWYDKTMIKTALAVEIYRFAGIDVGDFRYVYLFLNREPKGLYYQLEDIDNLFFESRDINVSAYYKATGLCDYSFCANETAAMQFEKLPNDDGNYSDIEYLIKVLNESNDAILKDEIVTILDVTNYLDYMAVNAVIGNVDAECRNFFLYREPGGLFKVVPWDFDLSFWDSQSQLFLTNQSKRLLDIPEYHTYYTNRLLKLSRDVFHSTNIVQLMDYYTNLIHSAYNNDPYFSAAGYQFDEELEALNTYILYRKWYIQQNYNEI